MKFFLLSVATILFSSSCSKEKEEQVIPLSASNIVLKQLSLIQTKGYLIGSWKLHYAVGGYTGNNKTTYTNSTISFNSSVNSMDWKNGSTTYINSEISWMNLRNIYNEDVFIMEFKDANSVPYRWGAEQILKDTLIMYENRADGYKYYLTRN